ncbi:CotH kinase family protein [Crocinitomix catalasitica]|uniref:CotH kinase family protein n=1 Tax=Crocinitomix catalasitica TaxID=184607 RepID=UPI000684ED21|nr:CotH kinase family protein [Crocinitomix catalasitica]
MKKLITLLGCLAVITIGNAQGTYDVSSITLIEIEFEEENWDALMDANYAADADERLVGDCKVNGVEYLSVGVAFKGNSTYNATSLKNPLNIKLDYILDQKYHGFSTFKLSNGSMDPSFVREVLSYEIARDYMDVPLSNYAKVTINGEYYGLFSSSESIDGDYLERRLYADDDNTRFKCNPVSVGDGGSSLEYLGDDSTDYYEYYELKSDFGWKDMMNFTNNLTYDMANIEDYLDVDRALWMLAFNNVMVNLDSYSGPFKQNYYFIKDDNDRFFPILWDLNQSIGSFTMLAEGPGRIDLNDLTDMDLYLREDDASYPLIYQLFSIPRYRKMYLAHVKTMVEEHLVDRNYYARVEEMQEVIIDEVDAEPNGFYTRTQFTSNLYETEGGGGGPGPGGVFGISEILDGRLDYYEDLAEWAYVAPNITDINTNPAVITAYVTATITANISDATYAHIGYRNDLQDAFTKVEMFDDGAHGDGGAGDGVFGAFIPTSAKDIQYYIYADNDLAGKFSPVRAEHEYYSLIIQSDVVINEVLASNSTIAADQDGEYNDWVELFNTTGSDINISGYYLSDRPNAEPMQWQFPEGTIISANDYLIVWLDEDTMQEGLHANFKLSANGESISFSDASGFELNRVKYPEMFTDVTYGRYENGTGGFIKMIPTFAAENTFTALSIDETIIDEAEMLIFPNPAQTNFTIQFSSDEQQDVMIYNLQGKLIYQDQVYSNANIDVSYLETGLYIVVLADLGISKKLVLNN